MAKKKKIQPITGTGRDPERQLTVQKSNPLYGLWRSELTLAEFKILDTYLSRINSHDPEKRAVKFDKGEIEQLLGVKRVNRLDLQERLKHLGTMVPVDDPTKPKGFRLVSLFERAECEQDDNGIWQVDLICTPSALKYIFNVENIGYFRYKLRVVTSLRSRYAYILFLYLEKNRHMHLSWEVSVVELRDLLKADSETYKEFKRFNDLILKPAQKELSEKTDCKFSCVPIRKGKAVKAIRFTLEPLSEDIEMSGQITIEAPTVAVGESLGILRAACSDDGKCLFDDAELRSIDALLETVPDGMLPSPNEPDPQKRRAAYLRYAYKRTCAEVERKQKAGGKVAYPHKYIEGIIKRAIADWQQQHKSNVEDTGTPNKSFDSDEFFEAALKTGMKGVPHA